MPAGAGTHTEVPGSTQSFSSASQNALLGASTHPSGVQTGAAVQVSMSATHVDVWVMTPVAGLHASVVHARSSLIGTGVDVHTLAVHVSVVHAFMSLQSAFTLHATHMFVVVLHTCGAVQPASLMQSTQTLFTGAGDTRHCAPAGQPAVAVQRMQVLVGLQTGMGAAQADAPPARQTTHAPVAVLHAGVAPPHSASAVQPVHCWPGPQIGVVPPQLAFVRQPTQILVVVSQTGVAPAQWVLRRHCTHCPAAGPVVAHTGVAPAQSSCPAAHGRQVWSSSSQMGVPDVAAQPASLVGLHCSQEPPTHCPPLGLPAHSPFDAQPTH